MTLAPIRGAPAGAPIPDFPVDKPKVEPAQPSAAAASGDPAREFPVRQAFAPFEIRDSGIVLTFRVVPELPAIARASMIVHLSADMAGPTSSNMLGFLRMSAANARAFLTDLRDGHSPIVAQGDEDGTMQIECENTATGPVMRVSQSGQQYTLHRGISDLAFDLKSIADELLADLGI
jgi:hypothetical protein